MLEETLRVIRVDLEQRVQPHLTVRDAQVAAMMIRDMLGHLIHWSGVGPDDSPQGLPARDEATAKAQQLIELGQPSPAAVADAVAVEYAALVDDVRSIAAETEAAPRRLPAAEVEVTQAVAQAFTDAALGGGRRVISASRVPGGYSKDTFFLDVETGSEGIERFVIRRDLPFKTAGTSVVDEFALIRHMYTSAVPVAEPLWCDRGGSLLGKPALLSRRVSGLSGLEGWSADPIRRERVCEELAGVLARLHSIAPADAGMTTTEDASAELRTYILSWRDRWQRYRVHPSAILAAGFEWLLNNIPSRDVRPSIVHGDINAGNLMIDGERISAVLDWEFAHVGDPFEDIGYCRNWVKDLLPWDRFLAAYRAAGGPAHDETSTRFFELWRLVRNAVCCTTAWRSFLTGDYPALKMPYQGLHLYPRFVSEAGKILLEKLECMPSRRP
jgi:aminoglycoside phosphotransferase (APT) family kinase protein